MVKTTYTIEVDAKTFKKMKIFYEDDIVENNNENLVFFARTNNCSISAYSSNKIVFQGPKAFNEAYIWNRDLKEDEETYDILESHAGSDEVGTGDFFGPIIVVAAYVDKKQIKELIAMGVKDSKKLTDKKIIEIARQLIHKIPYSSLHLDNVKYNNLIAKGYNMNKIKAELHNKAILNLKKKVNFPIKKVVVDQFTPEKMYYDYLKDEILVEKDITFVTKGETHSIAVACASIIARYSFLIKMSRIDKDVGVTLPKGSGALVDEIAKQLYKKLGKLKFATICKTNFKNYEKL